VDEALRLLELWSGLNESHRTQLLGLAETFSEWEERCDYP
jgi:hypothetical protein